MGGQRHENGAASAASETTPTIGQRPFPVCLLRIPGAVESCEGEPTHDMAVSQGVAGALVGLGVDYKPAGLRRAGEQPGPREIVYNLAKSDCVGVKGCTVSAVVEGCHFAVLAPASINAQKEQKKMFTYGQLVLISSPQDAGHRHELVLWSVV